MNKDLAKIVKRQGEKLIMQDRKINDYEKNISILLSKIDELEELVKHYKHEAIKYKNDLVLANKKKVEYRNQLQEAGIKINSVLPAYDQYNGKHAKSTCINTLVNNTTKTAINQGTGGM